MSLEHILFYVFGGIAVISALVVITRTNVVHSAVALAATLLSVAGIFLTLRAEFLAGVQVIVYVGGILVLFVFVIMLISLEKAIHERQFSRQWIVASIAGVLLIGQIGYVIWQGKDSFLMAEPGHQEASLFDFTGNSQLVGEVLYTRYLLPFEIASILLLVAIVGSVALAKRKTRTE